jgi:hypothetical protein
MKLSREVMPRFTASGLQKLPAAYSVAEMMNEQLLGELNKK